MFNLSEQEQCKNFYNIIFKFIRTEKEFREHIKKACSSEGIYIVVSFSRKMLGQTGDGHFSPIAGYHEGKDLVLVMDTVILRSEFI